MKSVKSEWTGILVINKYLSDGENEIVRSPVSRLSEQQFKSRHFCEANNRPLNCEIKWMLCVDL